MSNRRLKMFGFRMALALMRQDDTDRIITNTGLMGRIKALQFRMLANFHGWINLGLG